MCVGGGGRYACQRGLDAFFSVTFQYKFKKFQLSRSKPPDPPLNTHILAWVVSRVKCLKSRRFFFNLPSWYVSVNRKAAFISGSSKHGNNFRASVDCSCVAAKRLQQKYNWIQTITISTVHNVMFALLLLQTESTRLKFAQTKSSPKRGNLRHGNSFGLKFAR